MSKKEEKQEQVVAQEVQEKMTENKVIELPQAEKKRSRILQDALPAWLYQKHDKEGNAAGYKIIQATLARAVIERRHTAQFIGGGSRSGQLWSWDSAEGVWFMESTESLRKAVADEIEAGCEKCGAVADHYLDASVIRKTAELIPSLTALERMDETFERNESKQELAVIPCKSGDWNMSGQPGAHFMSSQPSPHYYFTSRLPYDLDDLSADPDRLFLPGVWIAGKALQTNFWLLESLGAEVDLPGHNERAEMSQEELQKAYEVAWKKLKPQDIELLNLLKRLIGYCFYRSYDPFQLYVFLRGEGGDGKSTFLNMLKKAWLGEENVSFLNLEQIVGDQHRGANFNLADLHRKMANISGDIKATRLTGADLGQLKLVSGGDGLAAQVKFLKNFNFTNYAKLWFSCNEMPRISGMSRADERRFIIFEWHKIAGFSAKYSLAEIKEERGAFIFECLEELKAALDNLAAGQDEREALQVPEVVSSSFKKMQAEGDTVLGFAASALVHKPGAVLTKDDAYLAYKDWCRKTGHDKGLLVTKETFGKRLASAGFETARVRLDGKMPRVWKDVELMPEDDWKDLDEAFNAGQEGTAEELEVLDKPEDAASTEAEVKEKQTAKIHKAFASKNWEVRKDLADWVPYWADWAFDMLVRDPDPRVRKALVWRGRPKDLDQLVSDEDWDVREEVKKKLRVDLQSTVPGHAETARRILDNHGITDL